MSETSDDKYDGFCSKINDKPVDAIGHIKFGFDFDIFKSEFYIEKVFGLIVKGTNLVLRFKLVAKDNDEGIKFKLIYISDEKIDCKFEEVNLRIQQQITLDIGDTLVKFGPCKPNKKFKKGFSYGFCFSIGLSLDMSTQMPCNLVSRKFNDQSSFDFTILCHNERFYVHELILRDQSEYFEAMLRNNCVESREKRLVIDDFEPKVVEVLLRQIYNCAVNFINLDDTDKAIGLMKIADKYNFSNLYDAIDSQLAQEIQRIIWSHYGKNNLKKLTEYVRFCEETGAPKLSTAILYWKSNASGLSDKEWSSLIRKYPHFALVAANAAAREDYQSWLQVNNI